MNPQRWKQIDELLDSAFDLDPNKRSEFLDHACAGDDELRKAIEKLLISDQRAGSFIEAPVLDPDVKVAVDRDFRPREKEVVSLHDSSRDEVIDPSRRVVANRFEIRTRLGKGGMGEVWHAYDLKLRVDVALKNIRIGAKANGDPLEALRREVRSAREVISPNVCRIFDLVVEADREFLSMEYIDGMTLLAMLKEKGPLELRQASDIAAQFLAGLEAIHQAGLVHCDLKPENIMITRAGRVVVMDFGIAKQSAQKAATVAGTLPYMSPEQISGMDLDAKNDVFSAGVVLAEMIHPDGIRDSQKREEIWDAVHRDPDQLFESPWKSVITRAVAENREDRFSSAGALSRALEEATQSVETREERNPYPGLAPFTESDADYFLGRELEVENLLGKLQQLHLMALIGPSGAGKTSIIRAGLIPVLPVGWSHVLSQPGDAPFVNLAQALAPRFAGDTEAIQQLTQFQDSDVALQMLSLWRKHYPEALLVMDRFEELFTMNAPEAQNRFIDLIGRSVVDADIRVLLVIRDDFFIFCKEHPSLAPIFSELTAMVPLNGSALRRSLVQPALKCGYRYEDEKLVDEIISDVDKERGALPLMAFAASRLWGKRDRQNGLLSRKAYREIGGVEAALAQHAEATMERIGSKRQQIVREIFHNLTTAQNTRAARDVDELLSVFPDRAVAEEVVRTLIDARLLTSFEAPAAEGEKPKTRVEIIHESLLTSWPRLVRWQTQDVDSAQLRDQLRQASQLWEQRSRSEDLLWTGTAYMEFQVWRQRYSGGLSTTEEAFANAMTHRANKKRRQRRIAVTATFVILLIILMVIGNFWHNATVARDDAVSQARRAEAGRVVTIGRSKSDADPSTKLAYALAGLELADSTEGRRFTMQALSEGTPAQIIPMGLRSIDFSPDGKWMAGSAAGGVYLFPRDGKPPVIVSQPDNTNSYIQWNTQFSPDGNFLIFSWLKDSRTVKVWSISQKKIVRIFHMEGGTFCLVRGGKAYLISGVSEQGSDEIVLRVWKFNHSEPETVGRLKLRFGWRNIDIDSRGRLIAYINNENVYVRSLDVSGIGPEKLVGTHAAVTDVRFHPNGNEIATSNSHGEIRLWSLNPGTTNPIRVIVGNGPGNRLWFDPRGKFLLAPGDGALLRWDLSAPEAEPLAFRYQEETPRAVTFDKESHWMAVAGPSTIAFYALTHNYPFIFRGPKFGGHVRFMPDGKSLVNGYNAIQISSIFGEKESVARNLWASNQSTSGAESIDTDSFGKYVLIGTSGDGVHLISIADGKDQHLHSNPPFEYYQGVALSADGKLAAASRIGEAKDAAIEIWNLESGKSRILEKSKGLVFSSLKFSADGNSLFSGADGNLYQWNLKDDSHKLFHVGNHWLTSIAITNNDRYIAASSSTATSIFELALATSELVLYDLKDGKSFPITSHGNRVWCVAFDPSGTKLVTGDLDGIVRVGPINGGTPQLLLGRQGSIGTVLVTADGKWIVTSDHRTTIKLWPMPEEKSFLDLPYDEFLNRLSDLTNVRLVADKNSPTGYHIQYAPFPGWDKARDW